jgi:hypothetical protein
MVERQSLEINGARGASAVPSSTEEAKYVYFLLDRLRVQE